MFLLRNNYVIFPTEESGGLDICIMDECGRYALIFNEDTKLLQHDLLSVVGDPLQRLQSVPSMVRRRDELFEPTSPDLFDDSENGL